LKLAKYPNSSITIISESEGIKEIENVFQINGWTIKHIDESTERVTTTDTRYILYFKSYESNNSMAGIVKYKLLIKDTQDNTFIVNMGQEREDYMRYIPNDIANGLIEEMNNYINELNSVTSSDSE
jgi:hypothetical protein